MDEGTSDVETGAWICWRMRLCSKGVVGGGGGS